MSNRRKSKQPMQVGTVKALLTELAEKHKLPDTTRLAISDEQLRIPFFSAGDNLGDYIESLESLDEHRRLILDTGVVRDGPAYNPVIDVRLFRGRRTGETIIVLECDDTVDYG